MDLSFQFSVSLDRITGGQLFRGSDSCPEFLNELAGSVQMSIKWIDRVLDFPPFPGVGSNGDVPIVLTKILCNRSGWKIMRQIFQNFFANGGVHVFADEQRETKRCQMGLGFEQRRSYVFIGLPAIHIDGPKVGEQAHSVNGVVYQASDGLID